MESIRNITKTSTDGEALSSADLGTQRQLMNDALARFGIAESRSAPARLRGRLLFGLDLTGSRERTLAEARLATASMFEAIAAIGNIEVKLAWYRGVHECKVGRWHDDPEIVSRSMKELSCVGGDTQIAKLLRVALAEPEEISGMVFIGDDCEEKTDVLFDLARKLGRKSVPLFIFHECIGKCEYTQRAKPSFRKMAKLSGGAYMEFKPDSGTVLREALTSLAAFSVAGPEGMRQIPTPKTPEALQLHGRLLMGTGR